jgi:hypothetical protein
MGKRLLPFRQYNEHDVINMFALDDSVLSATENITGTHSGDAGVFVKISNGNLDLDPVVYGSNAYLGKTDYPFVGSAGAQTYPSVSLKITPAKNTDIRPLGITLWETAKYDENGQKLIYYPQKAAENQVLLPGQSVPVATKGIFTLTSAAYNNTANWAVGNPFVLSSEAGKVTGKAVGYQATGTSDPAIIGTILATGTRGANGATLKDAFSGAYTMIKLNA